MHTSLGKILFFICCILSLVSPAMAGKNKDLRCSDWLNGDRAAYSQPDDRTLSYDEIGVKGSCKDFYPSWGERFKLERTSSDPFTAEYNIIRQYCWARNFIWGGGFKSNRATSQTYCGGCRMNFLTCKGNGWSPPSYASWGHTYSTRYKYEELESGEGGWSPKKVMMHGGTGFHHVCLRKYIKGDKFKHNESGPPHNNYLPKICAYVVNITGCDSPLVSWSNALIGCVDEPPLPAPPPFNHIMVPLIVAFVDQTLTLTDYINKGSTFDQPMVELSNGLTGGSKKTLLLRYKFDGDTRTIDNTPKCGYFPDSNRKQYCAAYDSSNPGQICACLQEECASNIFVGCAPRPNLEQSGLKIKTSYEVYEDRRGELSPSVGVQIITVDSSGKETGILPLTKKPILIREYYKEIIEDKVVVQRDSKEVYGVNMAAMIPKMVNGVVQEIRVGDPSRVYAVSGCYHFAKFPLSDNNWPKYFVPAGIRNRDNCACRQENPDMCPIPLPRQCISTVNDSGQTIEGQVIPNDIDAVNAYCPGYYVGPENNAKPDMICALNDSDFDFITQTDGLCTTLKSGCTASDYPSVSTGYARFSNKELAQGAEEIGVCDPETGFEDTYSYLNSKIEPRTPPQDEFNKLRLLSASILMKHDLTVLQIYFTNINMNIPSDILRALEAKYQNELKISDPEIIKPVRICSGEKMSGVVTNPCKLRANCGTLSKPSYTFFGGTFNKMDKDGAQSGVCISPFVPQDGAPSLECRKMQDNTGTLTPPPSFFYWDRTSINNPCEN